MRDNAQRLEELTYYENIDEGYHFTPINAVFLFLEEWISPKITDLAKILLTAKQLELCEKYSLPIDSFIIECYLTSADSICTIEDIESFIKNSSSCEDSDMTIQHLFTKELMSYYNELVSKIESDENIREKLYFEAKAILKEKYDYDIQPETLTEETTHYNDFHRHLIESEILIAYEKPETVLKRLKNEEHENHQKTYIKLVENK